MGSRLAAGDLVDFDWGSSKITGRVIEVYGPADRTYVTLELTPELSSALVDEVTTVTLPLDAIHRHSLKA